MTTSRLLHGAMPLQTSQALLGSFGTCRTDSLSRSLFTAALFTLLPSWSPSPTLSPVPWCTLDILCNMRCAAPRNRTQTCAAWARKGCGAAGDKDRGSGGQKLEAAMKQVACET